MFLDESTLGLDVKSISFIVERLKESEKTIFLTSHDMNVVEKLCDHVAFINKGKILKIGKTTEISNLKKTDVDIIVDVAKNQKDTLISSLRGQQYINSVKAQNTGIYINLESREYYPDLIGILNISYPFALFPEIFQLGISLNPLYHIFTFLRFAWIDDNILLTITTYPLQFVLLLSTAILIPIIAVFLFNSIYKKHGITGY
ncbi:MAG: hypothetical protein R6U96_04470 [Promethearchaeia archaeon]